MIRNFHHLDSSEPFFEGVISSSSSSSSSSSIFLSGQPAYYTRIFIKGITIDVMFK